MQVQSIDPRAAIWEAESTAYRLDFFSTLDGSGWSSDEYKITGAENVDQVLEWARADGRTFVLYVLIDKADTGTRQSGVGLIRLHGIDPTDCC